MYSWMSCSDIVGVWKKRSKKNGKISRKEEGRGQKKIINIKVSKNDFELE
jgi:hypothetical protein